MGRVKLDYDEEDGVVETAAPNTVAVDQLQPNPENPRPTELEVTNTANDLKSRGQLQNINIMSLEVFSAAKPHLHDKLGPEPYVVVNGCLRLAAAVEAALPRLTYEQRDGWDENAIDEALINENELRLPLNPLLLGRHMEKMLPRYGSARQLAEALNKQQAWVSQRLRLTQLHPELQEAIEHDRVMFKIARECSRLHPELQAPFARGELPENVVRQWLIERRLPPEEQMRLWRDGPPDLLGATGQAEITDEREYPVLTDDGETGNQTESAELSPSEYPVLTGEVSEELAPSSSSTGATKPRPQLVIKAVDRSAHSLARALRERLSEAELNELIAELNS